MVANKSTSSMNQDETTNSITDENMAVRGDLNEDYENNDYDEEDDEFDEVEKELIEKLAPNSSKPEGLKKKAVTLRSISPTNSSLASTESQRRAEAMLEAQQVLHSNGYSDSLIDDFNLLGVVMNPFGGVLNRTSTTNTSLNNAQNESGTVASNDAAIQGYDLSSITASVDNLTNYLNDLNHTLLSSTGHNNLTAADVADEHTLEEVLGEQISCQLQSCPEKYVMDIPSLQRFFHSKTGAMSEKFVARGDEMEFFYENQQIIFGNSSSINSNIPDLERPMQDEELASIPQIYFSSYFDLTNPETFQSLLLNNVNNSSNNQQHYEQLTSYLDTVEIRLLNQVKYKSERFFQETDNFTHLKSWIQTSLQEVNLLRSKISQIKNYYVKQSEHIPHLSQRKSCYESLKGLLHKIDSIIQAKKSVAALLHANDYSTALEVIHTSQETIKQDQLSTLVCFENITSQLHDYEALIIEKLCTDLCSILLEYKHDAKYDVMRQQKLQITTIIRNLRQCNTLQQCNKLYTQRLCDLIKVLFKTTVGECSIDTKTNGGNIDQSSSAPSSNQQETISEAVLRMTFEQFISCLEILMEQMIQVIYTANYVELFCKEEGLDDFLIIPPSTVNNNTTTTPFSTSMELAQKSFIELLRLRKESHSLLTLNEMKKLWDVIHTFIASFDKSKLTSNTSSSGNIGYGLKSTLLVQVKAFLERKHEADVSQLVSSLDCEKWVQVDVSHERQVGLTRLCTGRAVIITSSKTDDHSSNSSIITPYAEVEGTKYKVVWSCLLLIEKILSNLTCAAYFSTSSTTIIPKIAELLRLFNSRTQSLVLGAGAIHSSARLKSINAKHLALVTQCLELVIVIIPHVRAGLYSLLPNAKTQAVLLEDIDKIRKDMMEHNERVLSKFVSIIGGIVDHGLAPKITKTDFDLLAAKLGSNTNTSLCPFLEGIAINTRKMHQVLNVLLPEEHLQDVFCRIYAYIDHKIPMLFISFAEKNEPTLASSSSNMTSNSSNKLSSQDDYNSNPNNPPAPKFALPVSIEGKKRMIYEIDVLIVGLNKLPGVRSWDFTMKNVIERKLELFDNGNKKEISSENEKETQGGNDGKEEIVCENKQIR